MEHSTTDPVTARAKLADRIRKLFALANGSSSQAEAETALAKASALMEAHQLTANDIDVVEANKLAAADIIEEQVGNQFRRQVPHVTWLASAVAALFDGYVFNRWTRDASGRACRVRFFVAPRDTQTMMRACFSMLLDTCERAAYFDAERALRAGTIRQSDRRMFLADHRSAFSRAILRRANEVARTRHASVERTSNGRELVIVQANAVKAYIDKLGLVSGKPLRTRNDTEGARMGRAAGESASLGATRTGSQSGMRKLLA